MKINEFYKMIQKKPIILDGATGSNLQKAGMKPGVCPEEWILENEDKLIALQKAFVEAGTNILYAPTFSGNRIKLEEYGLSERAEEINKRLVALSKKAAGNKALVAGDMTMTGIALEPVGPMKLETLIDIYKEQARYLVEAGVDLFVVETMMSLAETRAAVIAIKEVCDLPGNCISYISGGRKNIIWYRSGNSSCCFTEYWCRCYWSELFYRSKRNDSGYP